MFFPFVISLFNLIITSKTEINYSYTRIKFKYLQNEPEKKKIKEFISRIFITQKYKSIYLIELNKKKYFAPGNKKPYPSPFIVHHEIEKPFKFKS